MTDISRANIAKADMDANAALDAPPGAGPHIAFGRHVIGADAIAGFGVALAIFLLTHPAPGIIGDAQIYIGRAIADLDPDGVGRDFMFRLEGQSAFSLFTPIARALVGWFTPLHAALLLTAASQLLWLTGLFCLSRAVAGTRGGAVVTAVAAILPTGYGMQGVFAFAEPLAEPRPFSEGFILLAVAAFLSHRNKSSIALLVAAALFHPIMALAGIVTLWSAVARTRPAWFVAAIVALCLVLFAALENVPVFNRLFAIVDPEWLKVLRARNGYLFPELWSADSFSLMFVQGITIVIGLREASPRWRNVAAMGLVVGLGGVAVAWAASSLWPSLLILQSQLWRAWWLTGLIAAVSFADLVRRAAAPDATHRRLVVAVLTLAWIMRGGLLFAPTMAFAALVFDRVGQIYWPTIPARVAKICWAAIALFIAIVWIGSLSEAARLFGSWQHDFRPRLARVVLVAVEEPLVVGLCALVIFGTTAITRIPVIARLAIAGVGLVAACVCWNDATTFDREVWRGTRNEALVKMAHANDGEILWPSGGQEAWLWLGRPNWGAKIQGAGVVFSRSMAVIYEDRARFLIAHGFSGGDLLDMRPRASFFPSPNRAAFRALCRRPDAPVSVVLPLIQGTQLPAEWHGQIWDAPAPRIELSVSPGGAVQRVDRYAVMLCADYKDAPE